MNEISIQEAFNLVKEFYNLAWLSLVTISGAFLTIFGVVHPIINYRQNEKTHSRLQDLEKEYEKQKKSVESMTVDLKIALGGIYLHQGNLQIRDYESLGEESAIEVSDIYLSYLKSLNYFLDASALKYIGVAYDQLAQVSTSRTLVKDSKCYFEMRGLYAQVIKKLEKSKDIELYAEIIFYLNNLFSYIERDNK